MCSFITRCWVITLNVIQTVSSESQQISENAQQQGRGKGKNTHTHNLARVENAPC